MNALFAYVLEMSVDGSIAILSVLFFRLILRKAPKWIVCALWGLVAIRLLIPFSFETPFSFSPPQKEEIHIQIQESFVEEKDAGSFWTEYAALNELPQGEKNDPLQNATPSASEKKEVRQSAPFSFKDTLPFFWLMGVVAMLAVMITSYFCLKIRLATSVPYSKGIRQSEWVQSPFILGFWKPVIYLPFELDPSTVLSVLAHEKAHIRRGDHLAKPFAWLLLSFHWFNPLLWLSYALFCKDVESACDEKVLSDMNEEERRDYARALLKCSTRSVGVYACPLAFGEQNVKGRIKMTLYYKKPVFWIIILSLIIAAIAAIGILSDPILKNEEKNAQEKNVIINSDKKNKSATLEEAVEVEPMRYQYDEYTYQNDQNNSTMYILFRKESGNNVPLIGGVDFGDNYLEESRERYASYYYPSGNEESEKIVWLQAKNCMFYYPSEMDDHSLTITQCPHRGNKVLATHVFKTEPGKLIYDADASPEKIAGLPNGAVFTINQPSF
ncbi:MAG: hypothetical protein E7580_03515 [Ruminococcaceae bacterium]|nr:hypothetical protein [Oscillospiraceae bacterium]